MLRRILHTFFRPEISAPLKELILGMLKKDPGLRFLLTEIKVSWIVIFFCVTVTIHNYKSFQNNRWVTKNGLHPLPSEEENCHLVTVTEEDIENSVRVIPRLDTLILVKAMGHRRRFGNPFRTNSTSSTSLRLRRKSSSVKDPKYTPNSSDTEMNEAVVNGDKQ